MANATLELTKPIAAVILGAGKGTRMKSDQPKVMHKLAGRTLLNHVIHAVDDLAPDQVIVVVGPDMPEVHQEAAPHICIEQTQRLGTGHAALQAAQALKWFDGTLMVLFGDTPLVSAEALCNLALATEEADLAIACFEPEDPANYGRIKQREDGSIEAIVEFKDANLEEREIGLCNGGIMAGDCQMMLAWLARVDNKNKAGEYYLTDLPKLANDDGVRVEAVEFDETDVLGINSRFELAQAESLIQDALRMKHLEAGVTLTDPSATYFSVDTTIGPDSLIEPGCFFGTGVTIGSGAHIKANSYIDGAVLADDVTVGPFAHLRPGTELADKVKIGNFVETKKVKVGQGSKINHLSYVGDALVGQDVNIGAGTITCNYDGYFKHQTVIEDEAFIGTNTALIAPVTIGKAALTAAGSTIAKDVPADAMGITRAEQRILKGAEKHRRTRAVKAKQAKA